MIGTLPAGPLNAITDVAGVRVGQVTVTAGDSVNTGVTAILPHGGNLFREKVPAAVSVGNGFGKLTGIAQVRELGELESPVVLTCTLCVPRAADAVLTWLLGLSGNEDVRSINVMVGETNDGFLNAIRARPIREQHVLEALRAAAAPPRALGEGSIMIVIATDAPLDPRALERLAQRAFLGVARTGSWMANGSGDFAIAFSTAASVRRCPIPASQRTRQTEAVSNDAQSPLFQAVAEATEEAILNSLFRAETVRGARGTARALPLDSVTTLLRDRRAIP